MNVVSAVTSVSDDVTREKGLVVLTTLCGTFYVGVAGEKWQTVTIQAAAVTNDRAAPSKLGVETLIRLQGSPLRQNRKRREENMKWADQFSLFL